MLRRGALRELSVALVTDAQMKRLHHRHMGINTPTDVLTFELDHDRRGRVTGGEVIVCVPQARRQARVGVEQEVLLCALHGMLHLCGFDDKTKRQFAAMHRAEDRLLSRLGVGPVYNPERATERVR
jgi:probable rRNA maturation factor